MRPLKKFKWAWARGPWLALAFVLLAAIDTNPNEIQRRGQGNDHVSCLYQPSGPGEHQMPLATDAVCYESFEDEVLAYMEEVLCVPKASFALCLLESGGLDSDFFHRSNNMFSMGLSTRKNHDFKVHNKGDGDYKSGYLKWEFAINDFAQYQLQSSRLDLTSDVNFIKSLKAAGYAVDPLHGKHVLQLYKELFVNNV